MCLVQSVLPDRYTNMHTRMHTHNVACKQVCMHKRAILSFKTCALDLTQMCVVVVWQASARPNQTGWLLWKCRRLLGSKQVPKVSSQTRWVVLTKPIRSKQFFCSTVFQNTLRFTVLISLESSLILVVLFSIVLLVCWSILALLFTLVQNSKMQLVSSYRVLYNNLFS